MNNYYHQQNLPYKIYIVLDKPLPSFSKNQSMSSIDIIQINDKLSMQNGYYNHAFYFGDKINKPSVTSWDKVIFYVTQNNIHKQYWIVEYDVFVPKLNTFYQIDKKYPRTDLLVAENTSSLVDPKWVWWQHINPKWFPKPWYHSVVCCIRISSKLVDEIKTFVEQHKVLPFLEMFYNTLATNKNLSIETPSELKYITWNHKHTDQKIIDNKNLMFHPVKNIDRQNNLRNIINTRSSSEDESVTNSNERFIGEYKKDLPYGKVVKFNMSYDRLGSMAIRFINLISHNLPRKNRLLFDTNVKFDYNKHTDYTKTILFKMVSNSPWVEIYHKGQKYNLSVGYYRDLGDTALKDYNSDLYTKFKDSGLKELWYNIYKEEAESKGWTDKWPAYSVSAPGPAYSVTATPQATQWKPYTVIHVRLDDVKAAPHIYDGLLLQRAYTDEELISAITKMKKLYPYPIYLVTTPKDKEYLSYKINSFNDKINKKDKFSYRQNSFNDKTSEKDKFSYRQNSSVTIISNDDLEEDIWIMANAEVLVTSFSNFAVYAAMLSSGIVYYHPFNHLKDIGIMTDFNKSGWKQI